MSKIIGIDLGSYNSAVSVYEGSDVKIIPNSEGGLTTPSYVAFTKDGTKVGDPARRQAAMNPEKTIFNVKRLMGKKYSDTKDLKRPYKIVDNKGRAAIKIDDKVYSPEEISAMIIQKMKKTAEDYLGAKVEKCIITVPAHFDSDERNSTKTAGEIAGLEVLRVIAEPTAAVLNVDANSDKRYAVYDFGGCTMDLSIVDVSDGIFEIKSTDGDIDLGGSLIDEKVVDWIADEFLEEEGVDLRKDPMSLQRLYEAAEKAKIELSSSSSTDINLPYVTSVDNVPKHLVKSLSKANFERLIDDIIERTIDKAKSALKSSGLKAGEIDEVLLVGGSSRIPLVQEKLKNLFGKDTNKSLNPDTCVSTGATRQGGVLSGDENEILLLDVSPLSVGIETMGGVFTKLVEANTTIPTQKSETFSTSSDGQSVVQVHILQGERSMAKDNKSLGKFNLEVPGSLPRGVPQIEITLDIDADGILKVTAKDKSTGKENSIRIEGSSKLSDQEVAKMKADAESNAESDKLEKEKIDVLNQADSLIFQTEKSIKELSDKITEDDKSKIEPLLEELKKAHSDGDIDSIKTLIETVSSTWGEIATRVYQSGEQSDETPDDDNGSEDVDFEEVK
jgi:molecular chaperone DnaK